PLWQRMLIIAAGPFMNFLLAFLLIAGYYMTVHVPPTVTRVTLNSPAHTAGLMPGDVIVAVDGQRTETAEDVIRIVQPNAGNPLTLSVRREKELIQLVVTPRLDPSAGVGLLGIEIRSQPRLGFVTSVVKAAGDTWRGTVGIVQAIGQMVTSRSEVDLDGQNGIITNTDQAARQENDALMTLAPGVSTNLGLRHLFLIPVFYGD